MNNPLVLIDKIKCSLSEVIYENDLKNLNGSIDDVLKVYSADLVGILINFYPGTTVMMHKFYRSCAALIGGKVYDESGEVDKSNYHIASDEEISFIQKSFPEMSDYVMEKLGEKIYSEEELKKGVPMVLRRSGGNIT